MAPPILLTNPTRTITPTPLTAESFAPFGTAIAAPLPRDLTSAPKSLTNLPPHTPAPVLANQSSALKYSPISPLLNNYDAHSPSGTKAEARMSMFSCFPRRLRPAAATTSANSTSGARARARRISYLFDVNILERHPFTTQTFSPLGLARRVDNDDNNSSNDNNNNNNNDSETFFLVIVAPTLKGQVAIARNENGEEVPVRDPPDLDRLRAFVASGDQAVTYGAGTWHAPMVVVGKDRVDFVVVQFVNGVDVEDCQEVRFGEGIVVEVGGERGLKLAKL